MFIDGIVVTAATGGIGTEISKSLARRGEKLILAVRNQDKAKNLKDVLVKLGAAKVESIHLDFDDAQSIEGISSKFESVKGLVICPPRIKPTDDPLPDQANWLHAYQQVFLNPLEIVKILIPALKIGALTTKAGRSSVVLVSGISSKQAMSHYAINNSIRAGWQAQIKTLANAFGPDGIAFNSVSLGGVLTEAYRSKLEGKAVEMNRTFNEQLSFEVSNVPLRRYAHPEDVGVIVADVLLSLSKHITGQNIIADGGFIQTY